MTQTQTTNLGVELEIERQNMVAITGNPSWPHIACKKHPHVILKESNLQKHNGEIVGTKMVCSSCIDEEIRREIRMPSREWRDKNVCTRKD